MRLHSPLKEFFEPLKINDPRTSFFATYRKEPREFDWDYAKKYDEDLNVFLIFAGIFSAVSSAFIIDVRPKLEPDPDEMTAAYMEILIHAVNSSLFPDANSSSATWTGPPPELVTVQSLLYASFATSLFAAFLAMFGKQWLNRYLRNCGGSAADKSRDGQRKLYGFEKWRFHFAIESLPVMLQLALLLLGCALSLYLWTISRIVAGVIFDVTLLGVITYVFLALAATLYYNCPYQTPLSVLTWTVVGYLTHGDTAFARSLRSLLTSLPSIKNLRRILRHLHSGARRALANFHCAPTVAEVEHTPLAAVVASPARIFEDIVINWEACKANVRCSAWMLDSTTDPDVIFSTVRFAADMILYPEIIGALSSRVLVDLFFDCLENGQVIPGKWEHASLIGTALVSVLSIHLNMEPENRALSERCKRTTDRINWVLQYDSMFMLVVELLKLLKSIAHPPTSVLDRMTMDAAPFHGLFGDLSAAHKLWLSRVILQVVWRKRRVEGPTTILHPFWMMLLCKGLGTPDDDQSLVAVKTNCFLIMAIALGLRIHIRDLYPPSNKKALQAARNLFYKRLQITISKGEATKHAPTWALSALIHLDPHPFGDDIGLGLSWVTETLDSGYPERECFEMTGEVVRLLGKRFYSRDFHASVRSAWVPPLIAFLSLNEKFYSPDSPPYPGYIALRILSASRGYSGFCETLLPVLASTLKATHPLQSRCLALKIFHTFVSGWFSRTENVPDKDRGNLLEAIGDPFQFNPDLPLQDWKSLCGVDYEPMKAVVVLIEFASSELWRKHLRRSNFTSCEDIISTEEGRRSALRCMLNRATDSWPDFIDTPATITAAVRRLEELKCPNTAEAVILWAWTFGVVSPWEHDAWGLIKRDTLRFYKTHGIRRLAALGRHIVDTNMSTSHARFLIERHEMSPPQTEGSLEYVCENWTELFVSQACQLRRLYHLFGYDPTTWNEAVVGEVGEEMDPSLGHSVIRVSSIYWACDYS